MEIHWGCILCGDHLDGAGGGAGCGNSRSGEVDQFCIIMILTDIRVSEARACFTEGAWLIGRAFHVSVVLTAHIQSLFTFITSVLASYTGPHANHDHDVLTHIYVYNVSNLPGSTGAQAIIYAN